MNKVRLNAYAKLNLTLDITGTANGYHMLDSLVTTVDIFDRVVISRRKDRLVRVTMHGMGSETIPPEANNAQIAAEKFVEKFGTCGVDIDVYKNIPLQAGMGGSSADSAAVIAGMGRLFSVTDFAALKALADECGSDTGYLLTGGVARMRGRGELVESLPYAELHFLILCPREGVPTPRCYQTYDELKRKGGVRTEEAIRLLRAGNLTMAAGMFGNDLYPAAKSLSRDVERAYLELRAFSPLGVSMTGSGSAVFAVFETQELCQWAQSRYCGKFRTYVAKSIDPKKIRKLRSPFGLDADEGKEEIWQKKE